MPTNAEMNADAQTIGGHPSIPLYNSVGDVERMITVCAECGEMRTIILLVEDRWYCSSCKAGGVSKPKMFPIS